MDVILVPLTLTNPQFLDMEAESKSVRGQLLAVCPSLEKLRSLDELLSVWHGVRIRMFMHYQLAARAYFAFLRLSGSQAGMSPALDDMNVTASLRLLRLLVKYAGELKSELESGFKTTPTKPWKGVCGCVCVLECVCVLKCVCVCMCMCVCVCVHACIAMYSTVYVNLRI